MYILLPDVWAVERYRVWFLWRGMPKTRAPSELHHGRRESSTNERGKTANFPQPDV